MKVLYRISIEKIWAKKNLASYLLLPLAGLYRFGMALRRFGYQFGITKSFSFEVPIIIVGNLTVGGAGKTPLVIALAQWLKNQGWNPGLVSRGYGAILPPSAPQAVLLNSDPKIVGDEALLLVQRTGCSMVVGKNRPHAVEALLKQFSCDVIISDDGLQHYRLKRNIEISVVDGDRRYGNGFCLPAGPMREPLKRLKTVNYIVNNGGSERNECPMRLIPGNIFQLTDPSQILRLEDLQAKSVHAIAGIGNPNRFFKTLQQLNIPFTPHPFPDHYNFKKSDLNFEKDAIILMTEKDAVKCQNFAEPNYWCLPVKAELPEAFFQEIQKYLMQS